MKVFNMTTKQKCIHLFSFFQEKQKLSLSHWNSLNTSIAIIYWFSEGSCFTVIVLFPIKILFLFVWRFNMDIRHIKITSTEGLYRINDKKAFKGLIVSILLLAIMSHHWPQEIHQSLYTMKQSEPISTHLTPDSRLSFCCNRIWFSSTSRTL